MFQSKHTWLRISYWATALADFGVGISVLIPERVGLDRFVYPMGLISAVAISWGILLIVADRKPYERRWVLVPTIIVILSLTSVRVYASLIDLIPFSLGYLLFGLALVLLIIFSLIKSRKKA